MNKSKFLSIATISFLVFGCTSVNESTQGLQVEPSVADTTTAQANNKPTKSEGNIKGQEFKVTDVKSEEQSIDGGYTKYEAAEAWTVVSVALRNTSGKRQDNTKAIASLWIAELLDSQSNKYESPKLKFNFDTELLSKPFSAGEIRSFDLLFDAPQGIKANHLLIDKFVIDPGGDPIYLKLQGKQLFKLITAIKITNKLDNRIILDEHSKQPYNPMINAEAIAHCCQYQKRQQFCKAYLQIAIANCFKSLLRITMYPPFGEAVRLLPI